MLFYLHLLLISIIQLIITFNVTIIYSVYTYSMSVSDSIIENITPDLLNVDSTPNSLDYSTTINREVQNLDISITENISTVSNDMINDCQLSLTHSNLNQPDIINDISITLNNSDSEIPYPGKVTIPNRSQVNAHSHQRPIISPVCWFNFNIEDDKKTLLYVHLPVFSCT